MDAAAVIRKYGATVLGSVGVALWLAALYLLASAAQNSADHDHLDQCRAHGVLT